MLIATPPSSHFELASRALKEGKWVLCEKPFVTKKSEAERLVALAAAGNLGILVGHFRRAFPSLQIAREFLADRISDVESVEAFEGARFDWPTESGYVSVDKYGNVIYDTGSHLIDMVLYALSLDRGPCDHVIKDIKQEPSVGPCHEAAFSLQLHPPPSTIPVKVRLSRYRPEKNYIRVKMGKEELFIRTSFRKSPRLKVGSRYFDLTSKDRGPFTPAALYDCFALEYVLLQSSILRSLQVENIFDAASFVDAYGILEKASEERGLAQAGRGARGDDYP